MLFNPNATNLALLFLNAILELFPVLVLPLISRIIPSTARVCRRATWEVPKAVPTKATYTLTNEHMHPHGVAAALSPDGQLDGKLHTAARPPCGDADGRHT